jgi:glutathione S-transferase
MPKLYYTATSCGAASFIAAYTAGLSFECELVDLATHKTASGADFYAINPKGNVPALVLEDGTVINENIAVHQYIVDHVSYLCAPPFKFRWLYSTDTLLLLFFFIQAPASIKLGPSSPEKKYSYIANQSYIASEVHSSIGSLFYPNSDEVKGALKQKALKKIEYLNDVFLKDKTYVNESHFTVSDAYLYIVLSWTGYVGIDLSPYPTVTAYQNFIGSLNNVTEAHARIATSPTTTF